MAANRDATDRRLVMWLVLAGALVVGAWLFPPFHVVRLAPLTAGPAASPPAAYDANAAAAKIWPRIVTAAAQATETRLVIAALRQNPAEAKAQFGKTAGVGASYYFVRGRGHVVSRERNELILGVDGFPGEVVALRIGPVFGNTIRDGCGLLDLNAFPGLAEFNALSAELNRHVEQNVLPTLRQHAPVGASVTFAGCAEAPEDAADPGEPVLMIVPVEAHVP